MHNTVINGGWFESQYMYNTHGTACLVSSSIVILVNLAVEIHVLYIEMQIYITNKHCFLIVVTFEIARNLRRTRYNCCIPSRKKYQFACSSILSYILIYHIFLKFYCSNHYTNFSSENHIKMVFSLK